MADPRIAFPKTARFEGLFQNDKADNANYCNGQLIGTMRGVSAVAYKQAFGRCPTVAQIKAITAEDAFQVFKKLFWDPMRCSEIQDQDVANLVVDWGWGSGPITAIKKVQLVLIALGHPLVADGKIGTRTLQALNQHPAAELHQALYVAREAHFRAIAAANPAKGKFLRGWLTRLASFYYSAKTVATRQLKTPGAGVLVLVLVLGVAAVLALVFRAQLLASLHTLAA